MKCVKCDGKMVYIEKNEDNGWFENHWRCTECDYTEDGDTRTDISVN